MDNKLKTGISQEGLKLLACITMLIDISARSSSPSFNGCGSLDGCPFRCTAFSFPKASTIPAIP